jgi:hypothetical protein
MLSPRPRLPAGLLLSHGSTANDSVSYILRAVPRSNATQSRSLPTVETLARPVGFVAVACVPARPAKSPIIGLPAPLTDVCCTTTSPTST